MSRLTLRLPDTLHKQIEAMAKNEGVSMNQYIVFALTKQVTQAYTVQTVSDQGIAEQREQYKTLLDTLNKASFRDIQQVLDKRDEIESEEGLTPEMVRVLREKMTRKY